MLQEFKEFIKRGNVLDLAVAVVIGGAFGKIVGSFVDDMLMPPIGLLLGKVDFSNLFLNLSSKGEYSTLAAAKAAGAPTLNYGLFGNNVVNFLIVAFAIFMMLKVVTKITKPVPAPPAAPTTKDCPFCLSAIPIKAIRCGHCTSELK